MSTSHIQVSLSRFVEIGGKRFFFGIFNKESHSRIDIQVLVFYHSKSCDSSFTFFYWTDTTEYKCLESLQSTIKFFSNNQSTANVKLSRVTVGGGSTTTSARYFPVLTRIPFIPMFMAPKMSSVGSLNKNVLAFQRSICRNISVPYSHHQS